ncbi:YTH domain-containing protein ECT4-like isoform X2 [Rosa rugosa]|uniref:YTH domain-containing protein ECT4-like isoform X2 n=1 Tax=Rosa rugosa TaxID=74645 RepID=UPI002B407559|nr:YTH domain-containing protein ECT4-like isoform X2 [Rosa rugosa]
MATVASLPPPADHFSLEASDLLQNLSLDSQATEAKISEPAKKANAVTTKLQSTDRTRTTTPSLKDSTMPYHPNGYASSAYYYGGYGGLEWGNNMNSVVYGYGYAPYNTYSTAGSPTVGSGQLYEQQYQYPPYFKQLTPKSGTPYMPNSAVPSKGGVSTTKDADQKSSPVGTANGISNGILSSVGLKENNLSDFSKYQNSSLNVKGSYEGYPDAVYGFDGLMSPIPWLEGSTFSNGQAKGMTGNTVNRTPSSKNQISRPNSPYMGLLPRLGYGLDTARGLSGMYANDLYGHNWNTYGLGMGFGSNSFGMARNGYGWTSLQNKCKSRGRGSTFRYGNQDIDGLEELNKGPRGKSYKAGVSVALNKANDEKDSTSTIPEGEQHSGADIIDNYSDAKFFIIKSYSEDDVHKSVKYNVWASTPNGNKKLNAAYQEAQEKASGCPVFLLFSVNASGQFVGLAEMVGPVDFDKNVEYWQQDKWTGCFPVKWHIVKDVPNSLLKHITLENNENKPVTNSRDTQEVKLEEGLKLIKLFKDHSGRTCLLDDFEFYEDRQKTIEEVKAKRQTRKKVLEEKPTDGRNDGTEEALVKSPESLGTALDLVKEPTPIDQSDEQVKPLENGSVAEAGDDVKGPQPVVEESEVIVTK